MNSSLESSYLMSTFTYKFDNIHNLQNRYKKGSFYYTDPIPDITVLLKADVRLKFYPSGETDAEDDYCSLYLYIEPRGEQNTLYTVFELSVIDSSHSTDSEEEIVLQTHSGFKLFTRRNDDWGFGNFFNLLNGGQIREEITVRFNIKAFTERVFRLTQNMPVTFESDPLLLYDAMSSYNKQSFAIGDGINIEIKNGHQCKTLTVSKSILTDVCVPFRDYLVKAELSDEDTCSLQLVGYRFDLVNNFFKSIHCGELIGFETLEDQLKILKILSGFEVEWVKTRICKLIEKSLNIGNVVECYLVANETNCEILKEKCFNLCVDNYNEIGAAEEWKQFEKNCPPSALEVTKKVLRALGSQKERIAKNKLPIEEAQTTMAKKPNPESTKKVKYPKRRR